MVRISIDKYPHMKLKNHNIYWIWFYREVVPSTDKFVVSADFDLRLCTILVWDGGQAPF